MIETIQGKSLFLSYSSRGRPQQPASRKWRGLGTGMLFGTDLAIKHQKGACCALRLPAAKGRPAAATQQEVQPRKNAL